MAEKGGHTDETEFTIHEAGFEQGGPNTLASLQGR